MGHGRCPHSRLAKAWKHGGQVESAIEAIAELPQVARQMLTADLMIGTMQAVLTLPRTVVEPLELGDVHAAEAATSDDGLVLEAGTGDGREAREPIGQHDGVGVEVALGEAFDLRLPKPGDLAEAQSDRVALRVAGQCGDERHLVG